MPRDEVPDWNGPAFKEIDDSYTTLVVHLVRAVGAMFSAFLLGQLAVVLAGLEGSSLVVHALVFAPFGAVAIYLSSAHNIRVAIRTQRAAILAREEQLRADGARQKFVADVQDALEMADDEHASLGVVDAALRHIATDPAELLLADSSRSHMHRAVGVAKDGTLPGCDVPSPWQCPAVRRGQTLVFDTSESIGACPRLRDRPHLDASTSAACVPVTVLGTPMGVIHTIRPEGEPPAEESVELLEALARQAGSRVGVLRAMASSEMQASTDSLTGLRNRRRLEADVRRTREAGRPYAVVLADLDHFKDLNDTYGHETGDRALRLFARVLEAVTREHDVVCRYGGEEFVLLLPDCGVGHASTVVERARLELLALLASGNVPVYTASFGVADSTQAGDFDDVLRLADEALFRAKQTGRNRSVVAGQEVAGQEVAGQDVTAGSQGARVVS